MNQLTRPPVVAGKFYPINADELRKQIEDEMTAARDEIKQVSLPDDNKIKALIVPHAGYLYSGKVAASAYLQIQDQKFDEIYILGSSHSSFHDGIAFANYKDWETPLGKVKTSPQIEKIIRSDDSLNQNFIVDNEIHKNEHSLEVQLPFLQEALSDDFVIVPGLVGDGSPRILAKALGQFIAKEDLIVVSTDLSHYYDTLEAEELDTFAIESILELNSEPFEEARKAMFQEETKRMNPIAHACGASAIALLIELAKIRKWEPVKILYLNSGDVTGNNFRVVGYVSIAFYGK